MFETVEVESVLSRAGLLAAAVSNRAVRLRVEAQRLVLAADWADLHAADSMPPAPDQWEVRRRRLADEHPVQLGGDGTPEVSVFAPTELALVTHSTFVGTRALMADALDLRHRLPRIWALLTVEPAPGEAEVGVEAWQARKIAIATRALSVEQASCVDAQVAAFLGRLSWGRMERLVEAAVAAADPAGAAAAELAAAEARFVGIGSRNDHHIVTLVARVDALDGLSLMALVNRLADILAAEGDLDPVDLRRATALGLLARPDRVLQLLRRHATDHAARSSVGPTPAARESAVVVPPVPEPATLERVVPEPAVPEPAVPEPAVPEPAVPEPAVPERAVPERAVSEPAVPDSPAPDSPAPRPAALDPEPSDTTVDDPLDEMPNALERVVRTPGLRGGPSAGEGPAVLPKVVLHVHLTDGALTGADGAVARVEGVGPITAGTVRDWLGRKDVSITVRPVALPADAVPADSYEIPDRIRDAIRTRHPAEVYPWGTTITSQVDLDHTIPYRPMDRGGPPGQTRLGNLGPLGRRHHRLKTQAHVSVRQPAPGVYLWRSTHGYTYLVTSTGTWDLGLGDRATALWRGAAPSVASGAA